MDSMKFFYPSNGVTLCIMPSNRFKTSVVSVSMAMPLDGRIEERAVLCALLRRCSAKYDNMTKMNRKLASLYGAVLASGVSKKGEAQFVTLSLTCVDDRFAISNEKISEECVNLIFELIFEPKLINGMFSSEDVETEKRLLIEKIDGEYSDKRLFAFQRAEEEMCSNELYSRKRYGSRERIAELTEKDVTDAWKEMLEKSIVQINVVGSCDGETIAENLSKKFEGINRENLCNIHTQFIEKAGAEKYISESHAVKQGKLVIGLRAGMNNKDDNSFAVHVMTDILGGGPYSKLFVNVREKMSLCYYCSAKLNRLKGIIMIQSGIECENEEKTIAAIKEQISDMQNGKFSDEELDKSIKGLCDAYLSISDTPEAIDAWYSGQCVNSIGEGFMTAQEYANNIKKVTAKQVHDAAKRISIDTIYMLKSDGQGDDADEN